MRDDQLQRLIGSLTDASDPDPAFADQLFARLNEAAGGGRPGARWTLLLIAALLVAVVAAGGAVASGLVKIPWLVVDPGPSPSLDATPAPSATASLAPELPAVLPPFSLVRTLTDLPLHREHDPDAPIEATIPAGEIVMVQIAESFGPVTVAGDTWYPVAWSPGYNEWPAGPAAGFAGWIAVAHDGASAVAVVDPRCPEGEPTVASLQGMLGWERLACLGEREITLKGSWLEGAGGIVPFTVEPAWLQSDERAIADAAAQVTFVVAPDADVPATIPAGAIVTIVGHHDDPAGRTCSIDLEGAVAQEPAHLFCREIFVVTSIRLVNAGGPAVGSLATTLVEGVRLRTDPGTSATLLGTLALGATSYVADGPVQADGYTWWLLAGRGIPWQSGCEPELANPSDPLQCPDWYGWAADGSLDGEAWLAATEPDCPPGEGVVVADYGWQPLDYLACFTGETRSFIGWLPDLPPDLPGGGCTLADPAIRWLACGYAYDGRLLTSPAEEYSGAGMSFVVDPASGMDLDGLRGGWVRLTGHFDDPAAERCAPGWRVLFCRAGFVVTDAVRTSAPGG